MSLLKITSNPTTATSEKEKEGTNMGRGSEDARKLEQGMLEDLQAVADATSSAAAVTDNSSSSGSGKATSTSGGKKPVDAANTGGANPTAKPTPASQQGTDADSVDIVPPKKKSARPAQPAGQPTRPVTWPKFLDDPVEPVYTSKEVMDKVSANSVALQNLAATLQGIGQATMANGDDVVKLTKAVTDLRQEVASLRQELSGLPGKINTAPVTPPAPAGTRLSADPKPQSPLELYRANIAAAQQIRNSRPVFRGFWAGSGDDARFYLDPEDLEKEFQAAKAAAPTWANITRPNPVPGYAFVSLTQDGTAAKGDFGSVLVVSKNPATEDDYRNYQTRQALEAMESSAPTPAAKSTTPKPQAGAPGKTDSSSSPASTNGAPAASGK